MKFHALICARSGSKGIKNKNIRIFKSKPLISYPIKSAQRIKEIVSISVSTDSKKIAKLAKKYGAEIPFIRPKKLSGDKVKEWDVWKHFVKKKRLINKDQILVVLPTTSPLRKIEDIKKCIKLYKQKRFDTVLMITKSNKNPFFNMMTKKKDNSLDLCIKSKKNIIRRQDAPKVYSVTTFCYIVSCHFLMRKKSFFEGKIGGVEIPAERSIDLDTESDLKIANKLIS
ncbi:MAG: acylneuraminate cytidylyltransferase [Candidatus Marinimicrobia bacterium]|nr:acylneuraminate cytidylyltransferase [Candidatus Neomarinimicrobiota bacterium]